MNDTIFKDGEFFVGCNYWASHAGTNMWHDWRPDIIDRDFELLEKENIKYLRIFPLWPDFQPIKMLKECRGAEKEIRMGEDPLPFTEAGRAGVSEEMADRFGVFCDLAEKHGLKLVVGLITGWMSGRLYVPELFEGVNVLRDPRAIKWQIKFVKYMVRRFKDRKAIVAWDLGNECNCLGEAGDSDGAYLWTSAITMAIKTEDAQKPVISGLHGSFHESDFCAENLGEILDILCTHPYPLFTPHCMTDPINEQKSVMHSVAETLVYRGLSGKPAFAEEVGTLGPMIASEENSAAYINTILHLLWAHNCHGLMWWCGFEQTALTHAPYDWNAVERQLGLFRDDFSKKPVLPVMTDFANFAESFKHKKLPERIVDAVCILTAENDTWLAAYGTFILAKQAGLDIEFRYVTDEIPEARAYIIPSVDTERIMGHTMNLIMDRVKKGAVLYLSMGNGMITPFREYFGLVPQIHYNPTKPDKVALDGAEFCFMEKFKVDYAEPSDGSVKVIARDDEGRPVMSEYKNGDGTVYFLAYPIENIAGNVPGVVSGKSARPYFKFYETMTKLVNPEKVVRKSSPYVAVTEHIADEKTRIVVAVNCVPRETEVELSFGNYSLSEIIKNQGADISADGKRITMKPNSAVVLEIKA